MAKQRPLTVRLDNNLYNKIQGKAESQNMNLSEYVRQELKKSLQVKEDEPEKTVINETLLEKEREIYDARIKDLKDQHKDEIKKLVAQYKDKIVTLEERVEEKNVQIERDDKRYEKLQIALDQEQKLHLQSQNRTLQIEEKKKGFFRKLFGG